MATPRGRKKGTQKTGGRKPGALNKATATVKEICRQYAPAVIVEMARLAKEAESETARIAAGKEILDRAYGKAPQPHDGDGDGGAMRLLVTVITGVPRA